MEAKARGLVAHEDSGYSEWGGSGSVRIDPGASDQGLSLTLAPAWGAASGGVDRLWSLRDARALAANDAFDPAGRLDAEAGYGLRAFGGRGLMAPYAGLALSETGGARVAHRRALDPRAGRRVRRRGHARRARQRRRAQARPRLPRDAVLVSGAATIGAVRAVLQTSFPHHARQCRRHRLRRCGAVRSGKPHSAGRTVGGQEMTVVVPGENLIHFFVSSSWRTPAPCLR